MRHSMSLAIHNYTLVLTKHRQQSCFRKLSLMEYQLVTNTDINMVLSISHIYPICLQPSGLVSTSTAIGRQWYLELCCYTNVLMGCVMFTAESRLLILSYFLHQSCWNIFFFGFLGYRSLTIFDFGYQSLTNRYLEINPNIIVIIC